MVQAVRSGSARSISIKPTSVQSSGMFSPPKQCHASVSLGAFRRERLGHWWSAIQVDRKLSDVDKQWHKHQKQGRKVVRQKKGILVISLTNLKDPCLQRNQGRNLMRLCSDLSVDGSFPGIPRPLNRFLLVSGSLDKPRVQQAKRQSSEASSSTHYKVL